MKKNLYFCLFFFCLAKINAMEKPSHILIELGEWHNKTPNTYEIEEISPFGDDFKTSSKTITQLGNSKVKKLNHPISLEPTGASDVARYRIYNIDDMDDIAVLKIEHDKKTNTLTASMTNPNADKKTKSEPTKFIIDKKTKNVNLSLNGSLKGKKLDAVDLNFRGKSNPAPRLIAPK